MPAPLPNPNAPPPLLPSRPRGLAYAWAALRSWLHLLLMGATMVPYALVLLVVALFVRGEPIYRIGVAWLDVCVRSARWLLGIRHRVRGMEHLPAYDKAQQGQMPKVVVLAKHQSTYETFLLPLVLRHVVLSYVFKKELLAIPFFGWGIGRMDMVHIDREQGIRAFRKVLAQGQRVMALGNWVIMFPEGTRVPRGQAGDYKASGARLAVDTGALVVPVAVASARCWAPRAIVKYPGTVDVSIGAPISTEGKSAPQVMAEVEQWIEAEMRRIDPQAYPAQDQAPTGHGASSDAAG